MKKGSPSAAICIKQKVGFDPAAPLVLQSHPCKYFLPTPIYWTAVSGCGATAVGTSGTFPAVSTLRHQSQEWFHLLISQDYESYSKCRGMVGSILERNQKNGKKSALFSDQSKTTGMQTKAQHELALLCLSLSGTFPERLSSEYI